MSADEACLERPLSWSWNTAFLSSHGEEEEEGVLPSAQDIKLPLPMRDTLNAGWVTNRSKDHLGKAWNSFHFILIQIWILQIPVLLLKTCTVIKYQKSILIWIKPKQQQCFICTVMSLERGGTTSLWPPNPWQGKRDRPWLLRFRTHQRPMVVRSSFRCASGQVLQAALISWHTNPHRQQRSARGQCREPGAVNQHWCCERPTVSFQSTERVSELPGWFVAWLLLSISLEITAGGGPQPGSTHSSITSPPLRKQREKEWGSERKTSPRLPPTQQYYARRQFCCQQSSLWQSRELFSSDICHRSSPPLFSFHYFF